MLTEVDCNYEALRASAELKHSLFSVIFTAIFVPKNKIHRKYVHLFRPKNKKNAFFAAENEKENEIRSASKPDFAFYVGSEYPSHRSVKDGDGVGEGIAGTLSLLQNVTMSSQPISGFDWSADKLGLCVCTAFDQTVRVLIVTRLKTI